MATTDLNDATASFLKAFNAGDLEGILAHYTPDGVFINQDGQEVRGRQALRETLAAFMAMKPRLEMHKTTTIAFGDGLATNMGEWTLHATGPDGQPIQMEGRGFDVMQRQPDGSWKMLLDNPWGLAVLG